MTSSGAEMVKGAADILEIIGECVPLTKSGINYKGLCPFHSEKTPSFMVNPARQSFYCFGCGEGGDVFTFLMRFHNMTFVEALQELAQRYNIPLPQRGRSEAAEAQNRRRKVLLEINRQAAERYHHFLRTSPQARPAREYISRRGIPDEIINRFTLGFAPDSWDFIGGQLAEKYPFDLLCAAGLTVAKKGGGSYDRFRNRILFPIVDGSGRTVAFGGRILGEGQPKYLNTGATEIFDKGKILFGLHQNRQAIRDQGFCLVVEGNFDLLSLVAAGIDNVVAPLGTALTQNHVRLLKGYAEEVILLFDGDAAGLKAALRSIPIFLAELMPARIAVLPQGHDPDTFVREQGAAALRGQLEQAVPMADFMFQQLVRQHGLAMEGKGKIIQELRRLIASLDDRNLQRTLFIDHFSEKLNIAPNALVGTTPAGRPSSPPPKTREQLPFKHRQLLEFSLLHPEYLDDFFAAHIDEVIDHPDGRALLLALKELRSADADAEPEQLLTTSEGGARRLAAQLLTAVPSFDDQNQQQLAQEMLAWLKATSHQRQKTDLTRKIMAAQQAGDSQRLMELLTRKKELDQGR